MRWITAVNLQNWADTVQARTDFPGIVADLICATVNDISQIRFPRGAKGQVRGFDGVLEATGVTPYVPDGKSIWEFGVNGGAATKATAEYTKRTGQVDEATRNETTFVFVSPRTWDNPTLKLPEWVKEKQELCEWKSVEYIDGSMLEDWLARCPAVAARYAKYVLKLMSPSGVRSIQEFWEEYASRFSPSLVEDVLLAGRESQAAELLEEISHGANRLAYAADSPDEVIAFAIATIRRAEPSVREFLEARTLVVDTEEAARTLNRKTELIFLPRGQARTLSGLLSQSGPTVVSAGADEKRQNHKLLNRPTSQVLGKAFVAMGFTEQQGYSIARGCGRSLAVLARQMPSGTAEMPEWMESAEQLLPALLAGSWSASGRADQNVMCTLGNTSEYEVVEAPLRKLTKLKDSPVDHIGDVWTMRSSVDAFVHLGHLLGPEHLRQFSVAAKAIFSRVAPVPNAEDVFKPYPERDQTHSSWLRDGMMNTLLHMAVLHEQAEFTVSGTTPQEFVNAIVRDIPGLSSDYRLMASLQDNLALLAEAAPIPFLEALERLLEGNANAIKPIFEEQKGFISPQCFHLGILWALETLAWDPKLLLRASICLARLSAIDPGGTLSNRPINSLRSIFLPWAPNTSALAKQRKGVLSTVLKAVPTIAWTLLTKLLPRSSDTSNPTERPKFREFGEFEKEVLTYGLVWESQTAVVNLALEYVGNDPEHWAELIDAMSDFPPDSFECFLLALDAVLSKVSEQVCFQIWDVLRKEVNRHRRFAYTDWALRDDVLARVDVIVEKYKPGNPLRENTWLFDDWVPDVPSNEEDSGDQMEMVEMARKDAILSIIAFMGMTGLVEFAKQVKLPQHVGITVQTLDLPKEQLLELLNLAIASGDSLDVLNGVLIAEGLRRFSSNFADAVQCIVATHKVAASRTARLFFALDESRSNWDIVKSFGHDVNEAYWKQKHAYRVPGDVSELLFAIENYESRGRQMTAIEAASSRLKEVPSDTLLRLLDSAIPEINASPQQLGTMTVHYLEKVFEELQHRGDVTPEELAKREFSYLPCFFHRKTPLTLHRLMVEKPSFYMEVVCSIFKPASGEAKEISETEKRQATAAYKLLEGLRVLPGQTDEHVDGERLMQWCTEVRDLAAKADRVDVTDIRIGQLLAHAPQSSIDHAWPHEAVRVAIENLASDIVEKGLVLERFNMRGAYSKALGEGGDQERALAKQAHDWASVMPDYPRTSVMLFRLSESWTRDAEDADLRAAKEALRE